jgi:sugar phosphate isomerase/epimerase
MHRAHGTLTRREALRLAAAGIVGTAVAPRELLGAPADAGRRLGAQLYTVRDQIGKDPGGTLRAIAEIGYREIEVLQPSFDSVVPLARPLGLTPVSMHIDPGLVLDAGASAGGLADLGTRAQEAGVRYLVLAWIPAERRPASGVGYRELGASLNRAGEQASRAGLQFAYHNHAFEFQTFDEGRRALDLIVGATDPALVKLELDVFWVAVTGADPVTLIRGHAGRVALLHLKDLSPGVARALREDQVPRTAFAEVGSGTLDFRAILAAGESSGVEHCFVEQDHTTGDPLASLKKSFDYLTSL